MQLKETHYTSTFNAFRTILKVEGISGLYRGIIPNAIKVVPNSAVRFVCYEWLRRYMGIEGGAKGSGGGGG